MDTKKQIDWWKTSATVLAFTALGLILFTYWIGTETWFNCVIILISSVGFAVGVVWWYWALNQIAAFANYIASLKEVVRELKEDLKNFRKDI